MITGLPLAVVNQIAAANFSNNTPGALVNGPGVPIGTTVLTVDSIHGTVTLSAPVTSSPTGPVTYYFFGPVVGTGTVLGAGQPKNTIQDLDMNTYNTLLNVGPLTNIQVTGPGIDPGSTVTVTGLSLENGAPVVTFSAELDASQISEVGGSFAYTFGYATLSSIGDAGFEQPADVAQLTGGYLHGTQLKPSGDEPWTFTDGNPTNKIYAGIAGNGSIYTKQNGRPPGAPGRLHPGQQQHQPAGYLRGGQLPAQLLRCPVGGQHREPVAERADRWQHGGNGRHHAERQGLCPIHDGESSR